MSNSEMFNFFDSDKNLYNVNCKMLQLNNASLHGMTCHIEPGQESIVHNHHEFELFLFLSGQGVVHEESKQIQVKAGMGIKVSPFQNHRIENTHATEPLSFISIYWEDLKLIEVSSITNPKQTLIFSTPPTPNGDLHLGHLSGPYLGADIYKRYLEAMGQSARHATGRDDNQTYVVTKGKSLNANPQITADIYSKLILKTLDNYHVSLNYFIEPNNDEYRAFVKSKFQELYDFGLIYAKEEPALYDSVTGNYLHEAYVRGLCPYCNETCDGNACEACGKMNVCTNICTFLSGLNDTNVVIKSCVRLYFRLSHFQRELSEYMSTADVTSHTRTLALSIIEDGLEDICVSHPSSWGIQCPIDGFSDHIIYVWFEMAFGYLWAAAQLAPATIIGINQKLKWYYDNKDVDIVHFYGYDNSFYHTLLFPAVYLGLGLSNLPKAHVVNELLNLDGKKFSTSRNHLIFGQELSKQFPIDQIRWYLCKIRPEGVRTNFVLSEAASYIDQYFNGLIYPLRDQILNILDTKFRGVFPDAGAWTSEHKMYFSNLKSTVKNVCQNYMRGGFSLVCITELIETFAIETKRFLNSQLYYLSVKNTHNYARTAFALSALGMKTIAELSLPITPTISKELLVSLHQDDFKISQDINFISSACMKPEMAEQ